MSPNSIKVARISRWENRYVIRPDLAPGTGIRSGRRTYFAVPTREEAIRRFRDDMTEREVEVRRDLRGKDLACYCRLDEPCHADVLLEIANS